MFKIQIQPGILHFKEPAGTSRGIYTTRKIWYLILTNTDAPGRKGTGECAPLPNLSCDDIPEYATVLSSFCHSFEETGKIDYEGMRPYPSMLFGLETALRSYLTDGQPLWDTPFTRGETGITVNGLIWMGTYEKMRERLEEKIRNHYHCIKIKIGAIDFEKELSLLKRIREDFSPEEVELRVDANGAFSPGSASDKLQQLSVFKLHSIEQPIRAGQWQKMAELCRTSPFPIALDEELIGINTVKEKTELLDTIKPQYIVLKPSLHGGLKGAEEWIQLAAQRHIGWWITSALESNVGLTAIAEWCSTLHVSCPQGLGTGLLFMDNTPSHLYLKGDQLWYKPSIRQDVQRFIREWHDASPTMTVYTSGSTGKPKRMEAEKKRMENSARTTCDFLGLKKGDTALLCMPLKYIAGKMMVVRSLIAGLRLITTEPSSHPLKALTEIPDFAAMTPMQVYSTLENPEESERLKQIKILIIGGGAIDAALAQKLRCFPHKVMSTYGMTETLSHIALRQINGNDASDWYTPVKHVKIQLSDTGTLVINAPEVCDKVLITNDLAEINQKGQFRILGRRDNVIDSGGIKLRIEEIEDALRPYIPVPFMITRRKDTQFGEIVALLYAGTHSNELLPAIKNACQTLTNKYMRPKWIAKVDQLPYTETNKPDRAKAQSLAAKSSTNELLSKN